MQMYSYPAMPMYTHDHATYIRHMYEWHMKVTQYHDQKKLFHTERAKHFEQMMGRLDIETNTSPLEDIAGAAS